MTKSFEVHLGLLNYRPFRFLSFVIKYYQFKSCLKIPSYNVLFLYLKLVDQFLGPFLFKWFSDSFASFPGIIVDGFVLGYLRNYYWWSFLFLSWWFFFLFLFWV